MVDLGVVIPRDTVQGIGQKLLQVVYVGANCVIWVLVALRPLEDENSLEGDRSV